MREFPGNAADDERSSPGWNSGLLFLLLAVAAWLVVRVGVAAFPGDRAGAHLGRVLCSMLAVLALVAGSTSLLRRGRLPTDQLALQPTSDRARSFLIGIAGAILLVALYAGALYVLVPFRWEVGVRSASKVLLDGNAYLWGNFAEELIFRGYAFIAVARAFGTQRALSVLAPAFGLFHLEGLGGVALAKMIATTGAMHFVFAYAYLGTRTLWAAVSLHAAANVLLHSITGLSGKPAAFQPIFEMPLPSATTLLSGCSLESPPRSRSHWRNCRRCERARGGFKARVKRISSALLDTRTERASGSPARRLTTFPRRSFPTGKRIAFTRDGWLSTHIFIPEFRAHALRC